MLSRWAVDHLLLRMLVPLLRSAWLINAHKQVCRSFDTQYTYKQVFNGLSVTLSGSEAQQNKTLAALKALPQVGAAVPTWNSCVTFCLVILVAPQTC